MVAKASESGIVVGRAGETEVGDRRDEIFADPFDQPRADLVGDLSCVDIAGQDRPFGVGEHHLRFRRLRGHEPADPGDRAAGADAADNGIHIACHLRENLWASAGLVRLRIGRIAELVGPPGAGNFPDQARRNLLVVIGMALVDVGPGQADVGAQGFQVENLLLAHLVRHNQDAAVASEDADQGEAEPGVARRRLDDRTAGLELAGFFCGPDHRERDPVLDRTAGILAFQFEEQAARSGIEAGGFDQRRIADQVEDRRNGRGGIGHETGAFGCLRARYLATWDRRGKPARSLLPVRPCRSIAAACRW